ncbi:unnamed protein product [Lampetra fluviatilis]
MAWGGHPVARSHPERLRLNMARTSPVVCGRSRPAPFLARTTPLPENRGGDVARPEVCRSPFQGGRPRTPGVSRGSKKWALTPLTNGGSVGGVGGGGSDSSNRGGGWQAGGRWPPRLDRLTGGRFDRAGKARGCRVSSGDDASCPGLSLPAAQSPRPSGPVVQGNRR